MKKLLFYLQDFKKVINQHSIFSVVKITISTVLDFWFDLVYQTKTFSSSIEDVNSPEHNDRDFFYAPVRAIPFHNILKKLKIDFSQYTFIDLGSGKGKALILASKYPFKKIIGVEKSKNFYQVSLENLISKKYSNIQVFNHDFLDYHFDDENLLIFLYDPCHLNDIAKIFAKFFSTCKTGHILYHNNLISMDIIKNLVPDECQIVILQSWGNIYYHINKICLNSTAHNTPE